MSKYVNRPNQDESIINQDNDKQADDLNENSFEEGKRSNYICCLGSKKEHAISSHTEEHSDTQHNKKIPNNDEKTGSDQPKSIKKFPDKYPVKKDEELKEDHEEEGASDGEKSESSTRSKTIANSPLASCEIPKPKSDETTPPSQDSSPSKE